jgi:ATP-dependent Clp protease ATP-binding subunit ClpC
MSDNEKVPRALSAGAQCLVRIAVQKQQAGGHTQMGVYHWLLALVERHGAMVEAMVQGLEAASLRGYMHEQLRQGNMGAPLDLETVVHRAAEHARQRGKAQAAERDLAAVILAAAGYEPTEASYTYYSPASADSQWVRPSGIGAGPVPLARSETGQSKLDADQSKFRPRANRPTPALDAFGRDLTREAQENKLSPVVGREEEIQLIIETLHRRTKRNPVLVGPAGVGKTAIVEGLAQRVVRGEVPEALRGARVVAVQPSTLVAGAHMVGELQKRVEALLSEARQDGIILFIDEVHAIVGAGGAPGTSDVASLFKPALARGDLACVAATTDDEYRRFIEPDGALERRFQPIRVQELTAEQTMSVLTTLRDELAHRRGVQVPDEVLHWLVDFAQQFLRNRHFPDKAVDLLEQCVAHAITQGERAVTRGDAEFVARRVVGMPLMLSDGLDVLKKRLSECALLAEEDANVLLSRLEVAMRGLDLHPERPNAVVLLMGEAAAGRPALAGTIAATGFGAAERGVTIDFSRFMHPADVTMLVGAPPGYVGYSDNLLLHRVAQTPWCVVRCENVHACHPQVRQVLAQALAEGFITDGRGKRVYLSNAVVLLTADIVMESRRALGFRQSEGVSTSSPRQAAEQALGAEFVTQVDLVCTEVPAPDVTQRHWLQQHLLSDLSERYRKQGVHLAWDESLVDWLLNKRSDHAGQRSWERLVDECLSPLLVRYLPAVGGEAVKSLIVKYEAEGIRVEACQ